ncbi:hypothetical protein G9A89_002572 [Geosiphon pyriformis]|nr:hypothetical protein G9A89_002572 [Geosiphon pyriformis]
MSMEEIKRLTQDYDEQNQQLEKLHEIHKIEASSQSEIIEGLQNKLEKQQEELIELKNKLESSAKMSESLQVAQNFEDRTEEQDQEKYEVHRTEIDSIKTEYESKIEELERRIDSMLRSQELSQAKQEKEIENLNTMTFTIEQLHQNIESYREKVEQLEKEKSSIIEELQSAKQKKHIEDLEISTGILTTPIDEKDKNLIKLQSEKEEISSSFKEISESTIDCMKAQVSEIEESRDTTSQSTQTNEELVKKDDLMILNEELKSSNQRINELLKERDELINGKDKLIQDLEKSQARFINISVELDRSKEKLTLKEKNYRLLESDITQLHSAKTTALEKLSDVESRLNISMSRERELKDSISIAKATINDHNSEIANLQKQHTEEKEKHNKSLSVVKNLKQKITVLEEENRELSEEIVRFQDSIANIEQTSSQTLKQETARLNKEITAKSAQITRLESISGKLREEKDSLFDQYQIKEAEFESSQSLLENLQHRTTELTHQLKECEERAQAMEEELSDKKRSDKEKSKELETLKIKFMEIKSESEKKISSLQKQVEDFKLARDNAEQELSIVQHMVENREEEANVALRKYREEDGRIQMLEFENRSLKEQAVKLEETINGLRTEIGILETKLVKEIFIHTSFKKLRYTINEYHDIETTAQRDKQQHEQLLEESRMRESHLRTVNKTLKDEIRKLQKLNSAASDRPPTSPLHPPTSPSYSVRSTPPGTPTTSSSTGFNLPNNTISSSVSHSTSLREDDVQLKYIRSVVLKFLESKKERPQLIQVLSTVLKLRPEDKQKLITKYG